MSRIKQKHIIRNLLVGLVFLLSLGLLNSGHVIPSKVLAAKCDPSKSGCCQILDKDAVEACKPTNNVYTDSGVAHPQAGHCYTVKTGPFGLIYYDTDCSAKPFEVNGTKYHSAPTNCEKLDRDNCAIINWLVLLIRLLSAAVGLVITAVIIVSGIQYSAAGNDPQKLASARGHIVNALLALVTFIFMSAFLQWVVPGGIY